MKRNSRSFIIQKHTYLSPITLAEIQSLKNAVSEAIWKTETYTGVGMWTGTTTEHNQVKTIKIIRIYPLTREFHF